MFSAFQKISQALQGISASLNDAYFNLVTLLLNTTSTNGANNNAFLDSSGNGYNPTRNGNVTQGTFTPFSQTGWSNYFDGTAATYLAITPNAAFAFGTGAYTVEGWLYQTSRSTNEALFFGSGGGSGAFLAYVKNNGAVSIENYGTGAVLTGSAGDIPLNTWVQVAYVRSSTGTNATNIYVNGVVKATGTDATNWTNSADPRIGMLTANTDYAIKGYISNLRVVKGTAVYAAAFTPPTTPLTAISGTSVLTCQSNRFVDNSSNAFTITPTGTSAVQAFSPFLPTAAYSTSVVGGSGFYNDGGTTSDYLSVASNTAFSWGTGDFSMESWVYPRASGLIRMFDSNTAQGFLTFLNSGNTFGFYGGDGNFYESVNQTMKLNAWNHCVVTGVGGALRLFVNGILVVYSATGGSSTASARTCGVGGISTTQPWVGYMSNVRLVKGGIPSAYSTSNTTVNAVIFTPPTAPFTGSESLTGGSLSLLCSFINAGIFDSAAKNTLITVGNAQVSTTQAKFGTTSMAFDGTGDWLLVQNGLNIGFNTGNFTVEGWINLSNVTANATKGIVFGKGTNTFALRVGQGYLGDVNGLGIAKTGVADLEYCAFTFSINTWYHIAVVRSGTTIYFFVDGVQQTTQGSGGGSFNFGSPDQYYIGCNNDTNEPFAGYMDDIRITKGYARYTANFTPPAAAFPLQ